MSSRIQFSKICEDAHFKHRVPARMKYNTRPDEDDGWVTIILLSVLEVRIVKILGEHGLEVSIPSTFNHEETSYV